MTIQYDSNNYVTYRGQFNSFRDTEAYANLQIARRERMEYWEARQPFNRAKKLYRDLLAAGVVQKGQIITNAEAKELSKMLEPQYLF